MTGLKGRADYVGSTLRLSLPKLNKTSVIYSSTSMVYILGDTDVSLLITDGFLKM